MSIWRSQRNVSSIFFNLCHKELKQSGSQKGIQLLLREDSASLLLTFLSTSCSTLTVYCLGLWRVWNNSTFMGKINRVPFKSLWSGHFIMYITVSFSTQCCLTWKGYCVECWPLETRNVGRFVWLWFVTGHKMLAVCVCRYEKVRPYERSFMSVLLWKPSWDKLSTHLWRSTHATSWPSRPQRWSSDGYLILTGLFDSKSKTWVVSSQTA